MTAEFDKELLSAWLDGEVTEAERAAVERAVEEEPALQHQADEWRRVSGLLQTSVPDSAPADLQQAVMSQLSVAPASVKGRSGSWVGVAALLTAAALVFVMLRGAPGPNSLDESVRTARSESAVETMAPAGASAPSVLDQPQSELPSVPAPMESLGAPGPPTAHNSVARPSSNGGLGGGGFGFGGGGGLRPRPSQVLMTMGDDEATMFVRFNVADPDAGVTVLEEIFAGAAYDIREQVDGEAGARAVFVMAPEREVESGLLRLENYVDLEELSVLSGRPVGGKTWEEQLAESLNIDPLPTRQEMAATARRGDVARESADARRGTPGRTARSGAENDDAERAASDRDAKSGRFVRVVFLVSPRAAASEPSVRPDADQRSGSAVPAGETRDGRKLRLHALS